jgi:hypothetical protein
MAPLLIGLLAGGGLGLLKGNKEIKEKVANDRYRKVAIAMSPWTGMGDPGTSQADMAGSILSGAAMGGMAGNSFASPANKIEASSEAAQNVIPAPEQVRKYEAPAPANATLNLPGRMPASTSNLVPPQALMPTPMYQQMGGVSGEPTLDQLLMYRYLQMKQGQ